MSGKRKRFRELRGLVRPEDRPKLDELNRRLGAVREKHHPGSRDPNDEVGFLDGQRPDDELEEP